MAEAHDLALRIGDLVGLARGYRDVEGRRREVAPEHRAALLAGLGYPVGEPDALASAIAELESAPWRRALAPAHVAAVAGEGGPVAVTVTVPRGAAVAWRVELEDGGSLNGLAAPGAAEATRTENGMALERRRLELPELPLGYHALALPELDAAASLIVAPERCFLPAPIDGGGRIWGLGVQLYTVRSARNWGIGDYSDLAALAVLAGEAGADLLGVNPFHARSLIRPADCSPYTPASRLCLDTLAIDPEALAEYRASPAVQALVEAAAFQARLKSLRAASLVDYPGVTAAKLPVLRLLYDVFRHSAPAPRRAAAEAFIAQGGEGLRRYAEFEAMRAAADPIEGAKAWWDWPPALRDGKATGDAGLAGETGFQLWLQFVADEQLAAAAAAGLGAGMRIGLYRDLAVAAAGDSAEAWAAPALSTRLTVGAPPDAMSRQGQNWGMPAPDPRALARSGFAPFTALLGANMRHAGALRLDHAMSLMRLFVIPHGLTGSAGTYLAYPFEPLAGLMALESRRRRCLIVGEDLGTVPEGFRERMAARAALSYKVLPFERFEDGSFKPTDGYPRLALATASTHDLPPLAGWWLGRDLAARAALGLIADVGAARAERIRERERLIALMDRQGVTPSPRPDPAAEDSLPPGLIDAIHALIAVSGAAIAMAQLDDLLGETEAVNMPGTSFEYPNWRRKTALAIDDPAFARRFAEAARPFRTARPR